MNRGQELIAAYLDDSISEAETLELNSWLRADADHVKRFVLANVREDQIRKVVVSSVTLNTATAEYQSQHARILQRHAWSRRVWKYAAATILVFVVIWFAVPRANPKSLITLVQASGPVSLRKDANGKDGGESVEYLKVDAQLEAGTIVVDGVGSRAKFAFVDGSTIELSGGSELTVGNGEGKQLYLRRGTLLASILVQPVKYPLRIQTPTAEATMQKTSFALNARDEDTFLRVKNGSVDLRRLADQRSLTVSSREQARAGSNESDPMRSEPVSQLPEVWRASQKSLPEDNWLGEWRTPDILVAKPRVVLVSELAVQEQHFHAGASGDFPGLVTLRNHSAIRVRYRIQRPLNLGLFISTHTEAGEFSGNFQAYVEHRNTPSDADGWRTAIVPITSFSPIRVRSQSFQPNCVASILFATTFADDVGLEVAELEVVSEGPNP